MQGCFTKGISGVFLWLNVRSKWCVMIIILMWSTRQWMFNAVNYGLHDVITVIMTASKIWCNYYFCAVELLDDNQPHWCLSLWIIIHSDWGSELTETSNDYIRLIMMTIYASLITTAKLSGH